MRRGGPGTSRSTSAPPRSWRRRASRTCRPCCAPALRVAPQATGHGSELLPELEDAVLLKTSRLNQVTVEAASCAPGRARSPGDIAAAAGEHGLAPVLGLAAERRRHRARARRRDRLAEPRVRAGLQQRARVRGRPRLGRAAARRRRPRARAVLGAARRRRALRGRHRARARGASRRRRCPRGCSRGRPSARPRCSSSSSAGPGRCPSALGAVFRYLSLPDVDGVPAPLRGRRIVAVVAAHLGPHADGRRLLAPLRDGHAGGHVRPGRRRRPRARRGRSRAAAPHARRRLPAARARRGRRRRADRRPRPARRARAAPARRRARARAARPRRAREARRRVLGVRRRRGRSTPPRGAIAERLSKCASGWRRGRRRRAAELVRRRPARAFDAATWERLRAVRDAYDPDQRLVVGLRLTS